MSQRRKKKQDIRTIEAHLRNYHDYKVGIKNLNRKLDAIMPDMTSRYELREGSVGTFVVSSSTERVAIDRVESLQVISTKETIRVYQMIVDTIDNAVKELKDEEREFIIQRYFNQLSYTQLEEKLTYSDRQIHRLRFNVMNRLLIRLENIKDIKI